MEIHTFSDLLNVLTAFLSLFFAFFLLTIKSKNSYSNILIALYLIIYAFDAGTIITSQIITHDFPGLGIFINTFLFFGPPLLYLYIRSVCYQNVKLLKKHLWHCIPFLLAIVILIPRFYLEDYDNKIMILSARDNVIIELKLIYLMLHLQSIAYVIASFFVIFKSRKLVLENYSEGSANHFNWLFTLLMIIVVTIVISTFKNVFFLYNLDEHYQLAMTLTGTVALFLICWLVLKALRYPELFGKIDEKQLLVKQLIKDTDSASSSQIILSPAQKKDINNLLDYMDTQEPYLEPSISVFELSSSIGLTSKELSILINVHLNKHFFDFINEYRIKKAMTLLSEFKNSDKTVLEILYEVGFNSKSSFNTAFKKYAKQTPTQFRKQALTKAE